MNSKRIELILIIAFLGLNLFLGSILYDRYSTATNGSNGATVNFEEELAANNIEFTEFSEENYHLPYIQANDNNLLEQNTAELEEQTPNFNDSGSMYVSLLSNPIELSEGSSLSDVDRQTIQEFLDANVLFGSEYDYLDYFPNTQQIRFAQTVDDVPITDGSATVTFYFDSEWNIISYEQTYAGPVTTQGEAFALITDKDAVEVLFQNNQIPDNSVVSAPRLAYYRTLALDDVNLYVPAWYITVTTDNNPAIYHVNAIDGTVLTSPTVTEENNEE